MNTQNSHITNTNDLWIIRKTRFTCSYEFGPYTNCLTLNMVKFRFLTKHIVIVRFIIYIDKVNSFNNTSIAY